jgi:hypothetical protein
MNKDDMPIDEAIVEYGWSGYLSPALVFLSIPLLVLLLWSLVRAIRLFSSA